MSHGNSSAPTPGVAVATSSRGSHNLYTYRRTRGPSSIDFRRFPQAGASLVRLAELIQQALSSRNLAHCAAQCQGLLRGVNENALHIGCRAHGIGDLLKLLWSVCTGEIENARHFAPRR